jgi:hypothetical protein
MIAYFIPPLFCGFYDKEAAGIMMLGSRGDQDVGADYSFFHHN